MDMEAKAQALREAVEGGASNSDLVQMLDEIQAAERERCVQIALDAPMVEPPLDDDPPEVDTALRSMAVSIAARIRGLEPLPRHGEQTALDLKA
jgi:hypothetical protein